MLDINKQIKNSITITPFNILDIYEWSKSIMKLNWYIERCLRDKQINNKFDGHQLETRISKFAIFQKTKNKYLAMPHYIMFKLITYRNHIF